MLSRLVLVLALTLMPGLASAAGCGKPGDLRAAGKTMLADVNAQRRAAGLYELSWDPRLAEAAFDHACYMASTGKFGHTGKGGSSHVDRAKAAGCRYRGTLAENISHGYRDARTAIAAWMKSPHHRENILLRNTLLAGAGYAVSPTGERYWVMMYSGGCR